MTETWLRFESPEDEEPTHEALVIPYPAGGWTIEWDLVAVGLVRTLWFRTRGQAHEWLVSRGYLDFTS